MRPITKKLALVVGSTLVTLLVTEVVFRVVGIRGDFHRPRRDALIPLPGKPSRPMPFGARSHAVFLSEYDSDPRGYFGPRNRVTHEFNSVGWRNREVAIEKPPGTFRVLGVGDSYLFGQGVERDDICLEKLPALLRDNPILRGSRIETINTGLSGMNTVNQLDQLRDRGLAYDPDLVIVHFVLNDVEPDIHRAGPKIEFFQDYMAIHHSKDWLSDYSYLWSWARQRLVNRARSDRYVEQCVRTFEAAGPGWQQCSAALDEMQRLCTDRGISLCVVIFPFFHELSGDYPFRTIHEIVAAHCRTRGIPVLDLRDAYREHHGPELWVHPTDQHPNEIAHDIAARATARFLLDNAATLLPKPR